MANQNLYYYKKTWFLLFIAIFLTIIVYSPSLSGPFVYDDIRQIVHNQKLHNLREIKDVLFSGSRQIRILQNISFAINWGISPNESWSFKVTNIFIHLINGVLLFLLLRHIFPRRSFITIFSVFLFLIHPLQVQSVAYVMGRISLIQTFFSLLLLILISGRWREQPVLVVGLLLLSYIAKESCLLLPLILLVYKISINGDNFKSLNWKNVILYFFTTLLFIPIYLIFKDPSSMYRGTIGFDLYPFWEYTIMQMYYYLFYLFLFFNSSYQSIIHPMSSMSATTIILGVLGGAAYLVAIIWAIRNLRRRPELSFFILFFFITLMPTNSLLQMINPFAEYRLYQSNISLIIFLALAIEKLFSAVRYEKLKLIVATVLIIVFSFFTYQQNHLWRDSFLLYKYALATYPNSSQLQSAVGSEYEKRNNLDEAKDHYIRAVQLVEFEPAKTYKPIFYLARLYYLKGEYDKAFKTINQIPLDFLKYGKPPVEYYKLKLQILVVVDKTDNREEFNKTLHDAVKVHGLEPFIYIT